MTTRQQWMLVAVLVAIMGAGAALASYTFRDEMQEVKIGSKAPQFEAVTLADIPEKRSPGNYKGDVVLLNIWATWCLPCRTEMPSIEALYKELKPKGLRVVAVSIDQPGKAKDIRDFIKEFGLTFDVLYDSTGNIQTQYRTNGVPSSYVIGRDGDIHRITTGMDDWNSADNRKLMELLLAEPAR